MLTYNEKINMISRYFGISNKCAIYMYHRRKKGYPFKKNDNKQFLRWDLQIQNLIILADLVDVNYDTIKFYKDIRQLSEYINIQDVPSKEVVINKLNKTVINKKKYKSFLKEDNDIIIDNENNNENNDEEWHLVTRKKSKSFIKNNVKKLGFIVDLKPFSKTL